VNIHDENRSHPGSPIKSDLEELGQSVVEAAKALGISRQQLHGVIAWPCQRHAGNGGAAEKALGSTAGTWLRMQMNDDLAQIRAKGSSLKLKRPVPAFVRRFESPALN
jgi:antitoxin HigA-1